LEPGRLGAAVGPAQVSQAAIGGPQVSVLDFGAQDDPRKDNAAAIQAAIHAVQSRGGGTVLVPGSFHCDNIVISGQGVRLQGVNGWLVDARLTINTRAANVEVVDLGIVDTRGDERSYLLNRRQVLPFPERPAREGSAGGRLPDVRPANGRAVHVPGPAAQRLERSHGRWEAPSFREFRIRVQDAEGHRRR